MWHTPKGRRAITGQEAALLRKAIGAMLHWIDLDADFPDDDRWTWGVRVFDDLTIEQQIAMLAEVGEALFNPAAPVQPLTAINEATIAAMFAAVRSEINMEIEEAGPRVV